MKYKAAFFLLFYIINLSFALTGAKYLIIAPDNYVSSVQPLADWKTKKGVKAKIAPLSVTGNSASQIKTYILNAYNNWEIRPEYILLAGFGSVVPVSGISDDYYANISGGYQIELSIGRLPCTTVDQCNMLVAKILGYERTPYMGDTLWFRKGTTLVNEDNPPDLYYQADCRYIRNLMLSSGFIQTDSFISTSGHNSTNVMNAINDGRTYVVYRGQAVTNWWSPFNNVNPSNLTNGFKLPVVVSGTCATMSLSTTGYQGDRFLIAGTAQNPKGAVAYFGTTDVSSHVSRPRSIVSKGFFQAVFTERNWILGNAAKRAKFIMDSILPNQTRYQEWNLFGDPELNLWTKSPTRIVAIYDTAIEPRLQTFSVSVRQGTSPYTGALVCLMMDTLIYTSTYTNSSGVASFNINPSIPGTMLVTVTGHNIIPYEGTVSVRHGVISHDVGVLSIIEPLGIIFPGTNVIPKVKVQNFGINPDSFSVVFRIGAVYNQTVSTPILGADDTMTVSFPTWITEFGDYPVTAFTLLNNDQYHANDSAYGNVNVAFQSDVGVDAIVSPDSIQPLNVVLIPTARIKNYGGLVQTNFTVTCSIIGANNAIKYSDIQTVSYLTSLDTIRVTFTGWTPTVSELCTVKMRTNLSGDQNTGNDTKIKSLRIDACCLSEGFNSEIFPPLGWQSIIVQGSYNWERRTYNSNPACTPYEGGVMASYPSHTAATGSMARLISPSITLSTTTVGCSLKFVMYHDNQFSGGGNGPDSVKIEYSTDGTNFYRVAAFRRYEPVSGWQDHAVYLGSFSGMIYISFLVFSEYGDNINIDYVRMLTESAITEQELNLMRVPLVTALNVVKPNPIANRLANISFSISEPIHVLLNIYDVSGKLIKTLANTQLVSGNYHYIWNGNDEQNRAVAKGVYFYSLETPKQNFTRKMIFVR
jgi:hypothetical protein